MCEPTMRTPASSYTLGSAPPVITVQGPTIMTSARVARVRDPRNLARPQLWPASRRRSRESGALEERRGLARGVCRHPLGVERRKPAALVEHAPVHDGEAHVARARRVHERRVDSAFWPRAVMRLG